MKKYAADNLMVLRDQYPEIYALIRNTDYDRDLYVAAPARNGQPNLMVVSGGEKTYLYSRYNPALEAARWAQSLEEDLQDAEHVLLFGFGLGYHAQALMEAYPDKKLYIYEPEKDILLAAVECVDLRPVLGSRQIAIIAVGMDSAVQIQMLAQIMKSIKGRMTFAVIPSYRKKYGELIREFAETVRRTKVGFEADISTVTYFRKQWAKNIIRNMERNLKTRSFRGMRNISSGIPAVIAGSGPSLGMEIEKLRKMKDRALIIAAGSSIQALLHHGLEPHLIVSMDPGWANERVFDKIDVSQIPFLYFPMIMHTAIKADDSPYLMHAFNTNDHLTHYLMEFREDDPLFTSTATVTGTAIQAAAYLGCSEIIFIGQDFSYPGDQVYTEGVGHARAQTLERKIAEADLTVENTAGGLNRTNQSMLNLKHDTEEVIRALPHIAFHNASTIGAVIQHTTLKTFDQAIEEHPPLGREESWFKQLVLEKGSLEPTERTRFAVRRIRATLREILEMETRLKALDAVLEEASMLRAGQNEKIADWFGKFNTIWEQIIDSPVFKHVYEFFVIGEKIIAERNWADMAGEPDLFRKLIKLRDSIVPLVEGLKTMHPVLRWNFQWLNNKVKAMDTVQS